MATYYVRSTDGASGDDGSTWALAKDKATNVASIDAAGDTVYFSQAHDEDNTASITLAWAGTATSRTRLIGVSDAAEPPTAVSTAPIIKTTGSFNIIQTGAIYAYGLTYKVGVGSSATPGFLAAGAAANHQTYENCSIQLATTGNGLIQFGDPSRFDACEIKLINTTLKFGGTGQRLNVVSDFEWNGGSIVSGSSTPTSLVLLGSRSLGKCEIRNVDFSNLASTFNFFINTASTPVNPIVRNCKLPASWSGSLWNSAPTIAGMRAEMYNCDSTDTRYRLWVEDFYGSIKSESTIVKTGGASDGVSSYSWVMATSGNVTYPAGVLVTPRVAKWNTTTGSSITVTMDIVHDSVTALNDDEVWVEVTYLGTSGTPLGASITDAKADILASAAAQTTSSATWTTTGLTNPNKQKLSVTFTPQEAGYIMARVVMAKTSKTIYVDPVIQVS